MKWITSSSYTETHDLKKKNAIMQKDFYVTFYSICQFMIIWKQLIKMDIIIYFFLSYMNGRNRISSKEVFVLWWLSQKREIDGFQFHEIFFLYTVP